MEPGGSECLSEQADHHLLHQEEPPTVIISGGSHQDDTANPAALSLSSSSSYARAPSSSTGSPTSLELKGKKLNVVRKKEERSRKKIETGREDTPHHCQGFKNICLKGRIRKDGSSWTGHRCQLGLTIGEGGKELPPGGRGAGGAGAPII
jgi:hypothetical protein